MSCNKINNHPLLALGASCEQSLVSLELRFDLVPILILSALSLFTLHTPNTIHYILRFGLLSSTNILVGCSLFPGQRKYIFRSVSDRPIPNPVQNPKCFKTSYSPASSYSPPMQQPSISTPVWIRTRLPSPLASAWTAWMPLMKRSHVTRHYSKWQTRSIAIFGPRRMSPISAVQIASGPLRNGGRMSRIDALWTQSQRTAK